MTPLLLLLLLFPLFLVLPALLLLLRQILRLPQEALRCLLFYSLVVSVGGLAALESAAGGRLRRAWLFQPMVRRSSEEVVIAMARAGLLGFFGAAGLPVARIEQATTNWQTPLQDGPL